MTEKERMLDGKLYMTNDDELNEMHRICAINTKKFNDEFYLDKEKRNKLIRKWFKSIGENVYITPPMYCDYGSNITIGNDFYANMDCIFLDVNEIQIGNRVLLGPRVSLFTAGHPIDRNVRATGLEFGKKIIIGNDVWIGGNTVINPGVTIGNNVVIGSGSVVVKDIPDNVVAAGNPCKVIRKITEEDARVWKDLQKEYVMSNKS